VSRQETPLPNWDELVAPIIKTKLDEAHEAQIKAAEVARQTAEIRNQGLSADQEYKIGLEEAIAKRWGLLEYLQARKLLEGLNNSQNVWRGLGTHKKNQFTHQYFVSSTSVEYSLEAPYASSVGGLAPDIGGQGTYSWQFSPATRTTYTRIGITPAKIRGIADKNGQHIALQNVDRFLKGRPFFEGEVLYVIDSDAGLDPVEGADAFKEGRNPGFSDFGKGVFLIDAEHPQAQEILIEVLKRSCIVRTRTNSLPFQFLERKKPVQRPKGFWERVFG